LYLSGKLVSSAGGIMEPFEWDPSRVAIRLGVNYVGRMDEVSAFDRSLGAAEIATLSETARRR
jgi:hypothetical protein